MSERARISNSTLNSYGTRVLTAGVSLEQYNRNPVLLYMHERGRVIGYMKDVKVEGDDITGEPFFDEVTEASKQYKQQWEKGSLKMVSPNFEILALSDAQEHLLQGQTRPTITECKLVEVSIVDIGGNDDNIRLTHAGQTLQLTAGVDNTSLPLINNNQKTKEEMDFKAIALKLGLPETATETDILATINVLLGYKTANETLKKEKDALQLSGITSIVEQGITDGKFGADKKEHFITLGKTVGVESLKLTIDAMTAVVKPTGIIGTGGTPAGGQGTGLQLSATWKKLSDVPTESQLMELKANDKAKYMELYKAEYGIECVIED